MAASGDGDGCHAHGFLSGVGVHKSARVGIQVPEELAHVGDARDVPGVGGAAVFREGDHRVVVVLTERRLQLGLGRKDVVIGEATAFCSCHGGVGGQDHRQPLRRARDGVVGLRQLARHTGFGDVREEGGAEGGGGAEEDEHTEARGVLLRLGEGVGGGRGLG
eukprot:scaffold43007_cov57-Phaeocystis_antarctica.AAC.1